MHEDKLRTEDIWKLFKNRYPLLMIDVVDEVVAGKSAKGFKNFSNNEWFFPDHFRNNPIAPGCVMLESLVEMFIMGFIVLPECRGKETADIKIDNYILKKAVKPGDRLDIESNITSFRRGIATGSSCGYVNGELVCSCNLIVCVPDLLNMFKPKESK